MTATTSEIEGAGETLPFSSPKQEALLGYALTDEKFFALAKLQLKPEWFSNPRVNQLWNMSLGYSNRYHRAPKATEVAECPAMINQDLAEQNRLRSVLNLCIERRMDFGLDALGAELTDWLHARIFIVNMKKAEALFNAATKAQDTGKFQDAYATIKAMSREIDETSFEPSQAEDMSDPIGDFERQLAESKNAISFGLPAFDRLLLPEGEGNGSLLKGDMTILLAPTNIGKTTTMVTIAAHNILQGKDVLLITHEGRVGDIKNKIWQSLMGLTRQDVLANLGSADFRQHLAYFQGLVHKHLEYLPLNKAGLTVEEVEVTIRRRQDRWMAKHHGKCFDLIIDDYAAKLTTQQARGGHFQLRQIHEVVYNYFSQIALAKGQECHVITAIQTNRKGSETNRKATKNTESRLLTLEDVMESWGPMTTATNVISINRDMAAQAKQLVTFYICKSRSSEVGWAVVVKSDYAAARSHWMTADCTWYRGTMPMSEKIDTLLSAHPGQEVPWETVLKMENGAEA